MGVVTNGEIFLPLCDILRASILGWGFHDDFNHDVR